MFRWQAKKPNDRALRRRAFLPAVGLALVALLFQLSLASQHLVPLRFTPAAASSLTIGGIEIPFCRHADEDGGDEKHSPLAHHDCTCCCASQPAGDGGRSPLTVAPATCGNSTILAVLKAGPILTSPVRTPGQPRAPPFSL